LSSDVVCEVCGSIAGNLVTEKQAGRMLCSACLTYEYPSLPLRPLLKAFQRPRTAAGRCPHCGCTQEQLEQTSLCGCPLCYEALDVRRIPGQS
jgi:protein-arginine kinase activator protein McsA